MNMNAIAIGLLRGDEGKGKIVDYLAKDYDIVVRFQGGPNAGHTIYRGTEKIVLHQIPSAILDQKICVIGHGCIIDVDKLYEEIVMLIDTCSLTEDYFRRYLKISKGCHVITETHVEKDKLREDSGKGNGSTKAGISFCYSDKYLREGIRICDYVNEHPVYELIENILIDDTYYFNYEAKDKKILFEGAQGVFLDIDNPLYPNVSSSHVSVGGAMIGSGISFNAMRDAKVVGIVKAYMSSVGVGKFLTEFNEQDFITPKGVHTYKADSLREVGQEYGATTGRPRKVGFLDLPMIKYACDTIGVTELCITRLDTLSNWLHVEDVEYFPVCVGYKFENTDQIVDEISWYNIDRYQPVYKMFPKWHSYVHDEKLDNFISYIEKFIGVKVKYISIGKNQEDIIEIV